MLNIHIGEAGEELLIYKPAPVPKCTVPKAPPEPAMTVKRKAPPEPAGRPKAKGAKAGKGAGKGKK